MPVIAPCSLDLTLNARQFLGALFNWGLYGVLTSQVCEWLRLPNTIYAQKAGYVIDMYSYYYPKDRIQTKAMVYGLYIWEMVQTILFTIDAYNLYASGWGDPDKLLSLGMVWFSSTIMSGIGMLQYDHGFYHLIPGVADGVVQLFYAWRIFKLTQSRILVGGIALVCIIDSCLSLLSKLMVYGSVLTDDSTRCYDCNILGYFDQGG